MRATTRLLALRPALRRPLSHPLPRPTLPPRAPLLRRPASNSPADDPTFTSILDAPPTLIRTGRKRHGPGLLLLIAIPITAFALGTWQVKRLEWKTELVAKYEDRLLRPPLPLPPVVNTDSLDEFDYRRVRVTGRFRHDKEMLVGPRMREGENGFQVVTPLERDGGSTVLVNRGWIKKSMREQARRAKEALPTGEVTVEGLLRSGWKKNMFTPDNRPDLNEYYFPDVEQMARIAGAQPVWVEEIGSQELVEGMERMEKGAPIGRAAEVAVRNNHLQYIFTWYGLSAATTVMLYLFLRKPPASAAGRVRHTREWS